MPNQVVLGRGEAIRDPMEELVEQILGKSCLTNPGGMRRIEGGRSNRESALELLHWLAIRGLAWGGNVDAASIEVLLAIDDQTRVPVIIY